MSTIGFGALEEGPNERSREDVKQYNIVTNLNLVNCCHQNGNYLAVQLRHWGRNHHAGI